MGAVSLYYLLIIYFTFQDNFYLSRIFRYTHRQLWDSPDSLDVYLFAFGS
ncbi:hypothetical protein VDT1_2490 [Vibrio sp. 16]|nr:hypothetical protein VDT1_2490 [Vibrio sp. 16]